MRLHQPTLLGVLTLCGVLTASCRRCPPRADAPAAKETRAEPVAPTATAQEATPPPKQREDTTPARAEAPPPPPRAELADLFDLLDQPDGTARILHLGDSHVASDLMTAQLRRILQTHYGDAGRGYLFAGKPWRRYRMEDVDYDMSREWDAQNARGDTPGPFGFGGTRLTTSAEGATVTRAIEDEEDPPITGVTISFLTHPDGGSVRVLADDDHEVGVFSTRREVKQELAEVLPTANAATFDLTVPTTTVTLETVGDGPVTLLGTSTTHDQTGVIVDAVGLNGATADTFLRVDEAMAVDELSHFPPDLVLLTLGTNDVYNLSREEELLPEHRAEVVGGLTHLIERIRRASPEADCVVMLPLDLMLRPRRKRCTPAQEEEGLCAWTYPESMALVQGAMHEAAEAQGCAVWDAQQAMGGPGSIRRWADHDPALAAADGVHLTLDGYQLIADGFAADLLDAHMRHRAGEDATLHTSLLDIPEPPQAAE